LGAGGKQLCLTVGETVVLQMIMGVVKIHCRWGAWEISGGKSMC
jgi:hypothetical protein